MLYSVNMSIFVNIFTDKIKQKISKTVLLHAFILNRVVLRVLIIKY